MMRSLWEALNPSKISEAEAVTRARSHCAGAGIPWLTPLRVRRTVFDWVVWTGSGRTGGNVELRINVRTGAVRRTWGLLPR